MLLQKDVDIWSEMLQSMHSSDKRLFSAINISNIFDSIYKAEKY